MTSKPEPRDEQDESPRLSEETLSDLNVPPKDSEQVEGGDWPSVTSPNTSCVACSGVCSTISIPPRASL
jgi:hypothetical protein